MENPARPRISVAHMAATTDTEGAAVADRPISRALISWLFDGHGFGEVARLVDVASLPEGHMIGKKLKRDIQEDRIEFRFARGHAEGGIDRDGKLAGMGDGDHRSAPRPYFFDRRHVLGE